MISPDAGKRTPLTRFPFKWPWIDARCNLYRLGGKNTLECGGWDPREIQAWILLAVARSNIWGRVDCGEGVDGGFKISRAHCRNKDSQKTLVEEEIPVDRRRKHFDIGFQHWHTTFKPLKKFNFLLNQRKNKTVEKRTICWCCFLVTTLSQRTSTWGRCNEKKRKKFHLYFHRRNVL